LLVQEILIQQINKVIVDETHSELLDDCDLSLWVLYTRIEQQTRVIVTPSNTRLDTTTPITNPRPAEMDKNTNG